MARVVRESRKNAADEDERQQELHVAERAMQPRRPGSPAPGRGTARITTSGTSTAHSAAAARLAIAAASEPPRP